MDTKGFEKKPWFPYLKNMYDEIGEDMMGVDAKGYEEKPWWPYVQDLQAKIDAGGGGGSSDFSTATVTVTGGAIVGHFPLCSDYTGQEAPVDYALSATETILEGAYEIALWKGCTAVSFYTETKGATMALSGDIVNVVDDFYLITGNCTITVTNPL